MNPNNPKHQNKPAFDTATRFLRDIRSPAEQLLPFDLAYRALLYAQSEGWTAPEEREAPAQSTTAARVARAIVDTWSAKSLTDDEGVGLIAAALAAKDEDLRVEREKWDEHRRDLVAAKREMIAVADEERTKAAEARAVADAEAALRREYERRALAAESALADEEKEHSETLKTLDAVHKELAEARSRALPEDVEIRVEKALKPWLGVWGSGAQLDARNAVLDALLRREDDGAALKVRP